MRGGPQHAWWAAPPSPDRLLTRTKYRPDVPALAASRAARSMEVATAAAAQSERQGERWRGCGLVRAAAAVQIDDQSGFPLTSESYQSRWPGQGCAQTTSQLAGGVCVRLRGHRSDFKVSELDPKVLDGWSKTQSAQKGEPGMAARSCQKRCSGKGDFLLLAGLLAGFSTKRRASRRSLNVLLAIS